MVGKCWRLDWYLAVVKSLPLLFTSRNYAGHFWDGYPPSFGHVWFQIQTVSFPQVKTP